MKLSWGKLLLIGLSVIAVVDSYVTGLGNILEQFFAALLVIS